MLPLSISLFFNMAIPLGTIGHLISCKFFEMFDTDQEKHSYVHKAIYLRWFFPTIPRKINGWLEPKKSPDWKGISS